MKNKEKVQLEETIPPIKISKMDVREWSLEMRENNIAMDEFNVEVKAEKMKELLVQQRSLNLKVKLKENQMGLSCSKLRLSLAGLKKKVIIER